MKGDAREISSGDKLAIEDVRLKVKVEAKDPEVCVRCMLWKAIQALRQQASFLFFSSVLLFSHRSGIWCVGRVRDVKCFGASKRTTAKDGQCRVSVSE